MRPWVGGLLFPAFACAGPVYDGYEAYYSTLPSPLFQEAGRQLLRPYSVPKNDGIRFAWEGRVNGEARRVALEGGTIRLGNQSFRISAAKAFPGETLHKSDLGTGTEAFFHQDYVCLENTPATASGTAVRHKSVFLLRVGVKPKAFKLPSLFASCLGIRLADGQQLTFDKVEYVYQSDKDYPSGVIFSEYSLRGDEFVATGVATHATFVDPENVYRFSVEQLRGSR